MKIYLAGSVAGKTREREEFLKRMPRLLSFYEIHNKLFNSHLSFFIRTKDYENLSCNLDAGDFQGESLTKKNAVQRLLSYFHTKDKTYIKTGR